MLSLYIIIILLNIGFSKYNSRLLEIINLIFLTILIGGNNYNADFTDYSMFYEDEIKGTFEVGYLFISELCLQHGLSFMAMKIILSLFSILTVYFSCRYVKSNYSVFCLLYLSTLCFIDAVQIRQMVSYALFTSALCVYSKGKRILPIVLMALSVAFQYTSILFLLFFIFSKYLNNERIMKWVWRVLLLFCFVIFLNGNTLPSFILNLTGFLDDSKRAYFESAGRFGFILYFAYVYLCRYITGVIKKRQSDKSSHDMKMLADTVYAAYTFSILGLPFVMMNNTFFRFFVFPLMGLFLLIGFYFVRGQEKTGVRYSQSNKSDNLFVIRICAALIFAYNLLLQESTVVNDVFNHNMFENIFSIL